MNQPWKMKMQDEAYIFPGYVIVLVVSHCRYHGGARDL